MYRLEYQTSEITVDSVFQDIYQVLERLQQGNSRIESIAALVVDCARQLKNLEKIHSLRWKFYGPDSTQDPFELRDILNRFLSSSNAFAYISSASAFDDDEEIPDGCLLASVLPSKKSNWKLKQYKTIEAEFLDHQKTLKVALANAVNVTSIRMQSMAHSSDEILPQILTQSGIRKSKYSASSSKLNISAMNSLAEMDWELCLRRYFDYIESWNSFPSQLDGRRSSLNNNQPQPLKMLHRNNSTSSIYSSLMDEKDIDTSVYYRKPRRRGSVSSRASSDNDDSDRRTMSLRSTSTNANALVLYSSTSPSSTASPATPQMAFSMGFQRPRPIRRSSVSSDFQWEYIGKSSTFVRLAPLAARYPELKDAQVDIYTQTQNMPVNQARAYAQGRLASLPAEVVNEVQRLLIAESNGEPPLVHELEQPIVHELEQPQPNTLQPNMFQRHTLQPHVPTQANKAPEERQPRPRERHTIQPYMNAEAKRRSLSYDSSLKLASLPHNTRPSSLTHNTSITNNRRSSLPRARHSARGGSVRRKQVVQNIPPLKIPTSPSLPRTFNPAPKLSTSPRKADSTKNRPINPNVFGPPPSMEPIPSDLRSQLSKTRSWKSPIPAAFLSAASSTANLLDALHGPRPLTAISERPSTSRTSRSHASSMLSISRPTSIMGFQRKSILSQSVLPATAEDGPREGSAGSDSTRVSNAEKPLPPPPRKKGIFARIRASAGPGSSSESVSSPLSGAAGRALLGGSVHANGNIHTGKELAPPATLSRPKSGNISRESLTRVSMEMLRRKDSKLALMATVTEGTGLEVPFELWLKALPYIEGRGTNTTTQ